MYAFCLSCPSTTLVALQHDGFVSREWLAANGLLRYHSFCLVATKTKEVIQYYNLGPVYMKVGDPW